MEFNSLEGIYIIVAGVGIIVSVLGVLIGDVHFHSFDGGHVSHSFHTSHIGNADHSGHSIAAENTPESLPILNLQAIFAFMIGFGSSGLISYIKYQSNIVSYGFAVLGGSLCWYLIRALLKVLLKNQTAFMTTTLNDAIGQTGSVVSKIYTDAIGEVMYTSNGASNIIRAKSEASNSIEKGEKVVIVKIDDSIATVVKEDSPLLR